MAVITRCSIAGSTEVQAACRRATKSIFVVTTSRYTSSLRWPHRKKSNGVRCGERGGHRTGPPRPIQRPGYSTSSQPRTGAQKCAGAPSCWNQSPCIAANGMSSRNSGKT
ncbi:hypothetical protein AVEN_54586-1 [Araneus ventricosus]|uniref:Uncharacterized protein n=1 Tax=Araneus ventricosus TaxID=182803 RepID=A0A4Y2BL01_ARAVE|nr:hypothetical protein AVEN_54586-1 [Araneus ventricosus]